ncbi:MAG: D-alanine--D-alanine ligase [Robiginitomaculum sp.]|nr:D-alanine--D-alanine ligase [Robiginitomaculum sp.]MDQ7077655.1 D-alanine--D-alanine ligase [Robiginitomaculum sp.]
MSRHIAVLLGGLSPEREVSLVSGKACADALRRQGWQVSEIDAGRDLAAELDRINPDVIFNALHGEWGEDGRVQGILDTFGKPYTHSGVAASALAMDKHRAKAVLEAAGIKCPKSVLVSRFEAAKTHILLPPYVAKPNAQGSSVGVVIVREGATHPPAILGGDDWPYGDEILIEEYIPGRELTVAVLGDRALAVTEICPHTAFYDYEAKYADGGSVHQIPADIPKTIEKMAMEQALAAHRALDCRGLTRSDFRFDDENNFLRLLEINTQPGMTATSLAPEQANHVGIGFDDLVEWMAENAHVPCCAAGKTKD